MTEIPDDRYDAVVDRIEEGLATLELDGDEDRYELVIDEASLPEAGQHEGAVYEIAVEDDRLVDARYDEEATEERSEAAQERFDRLSERPPDDDEE
ncbi:DUF3006 domain-containing protein [Halomicrobium salinisoli]|uniref:DUF3006 domain-containing protein n=1 Tax=Halomicrobium salinisoli TaxID=2878391 RepID=UPI001CF0984C|nr:DUF3006 domain-containing protein [Halomicrobium salinisoli]